MKFEIKARFTGVTLFTAELDAKFESSPERVKLGEAVKLATLRGADLQGDKESPALKLKTKNAVFMVGPLGSREDYFTAYNTEEGLYVRAGCFFDTLDAFAKAVNETHGDSTHGKNYTAAIALIRAWGV